MGEIACEDDGLAGPCMVLWEELKTSLLLSFSVVVIVESLFLFTKNYPSLF